MTDSARKKRTVAAMAFIAFVAILGAAIFTAVRLWQVRAPSAPSGSRPAERSESGEFASDVPSLQKCAQDPAAVVGMKTLSADPAGIAPPEAAQRTAAFERRSRQGVEQMATYHSSRTMEKIVQHYRHVLSDKGFAVRMHLDKGETRLLTARCGDAQAVLRLHKGPQSRKIVNITLLVVSLDATTQPTQP